MREPLAIRDLIAGWLRKRGPEAELTCCLLEQRWTEIVGERLASRTAPSALKQGVLTVTVASAAWLNELTFLRAELLDRIKQAAGSAAVRRLRFVTGELPPPAAWAAPAEGEPLLRRLTPAEVEAVEREIDSIGDPGLRSVIRAARLAELARRSPP